MIMNTTTAAAGLLGDCVEGDLSVLPEGPGWRIVLTIDAGFSSAKDARSALDYYRGELRRVKREARKEQAANRPLPIAAVRPPARRSARPNTYSR